MHVCIWACIQKGLIVLQDFWLPQIKRNYMNDKVSTVFLSMAHRAADIYITCKAIAELLGYAPAYVCPTENTDKWDPPAQPAVSCTFPIGSCSELWSPYCPGTESWLQPAGLEQSAPRLFPHSSIPGQDTTKLRSDEEMDHKQSAYLHWQTTSWIHRL